MKPPSGGQGSDHTAEILAEIDADFETIRRLSKDGSLCAGLGSPVSLMKDIFAKSVEVTGGTRVSQEPLISGSKLLLYGYIGSVRGCRVGWLP